MKQAVREEVAEDEQVSKAWVFFDDECALCSKLAGWAMRKGGEVSLKFLPQDGPAFKELFSKHERKELSATLVVVSPQGDVLSGYRAVQFVLVQSKGLPRFIRRFVRVVPVFIGKGIYRLVAHYRHSLCPSAYGKNHSPRLLRHVR